jgi:hypothetical protein
MWEVDRVDAIRELQPLPGWVLSLALGRDGKTLASGSTESSIRLWAPDAGLREGLVPVKEPMQLGAHPGGVLGVALSADGRTLASCGKDRRVRLWDAATGKERWVLRGHPAWVETLAFAPEGNLLATGDVEGGLFLWDGLSGKELGRIAAHPGGITGLAFAADGKQLVSTGADTTALVWDVPALLEASRLRPIRLSAVELRTLWEQLADEDEDRADQAIRPLVGGVRDSLPFLKERLQPISTERLRQLLTDLEDDQFAVRRKADEDLGQLGRFVEPALRKALMGQPSLDARRHMEQLLQRLEEKPPSQEYRRALRALQVLEQSATPEARTHLAALARGAPDTELTRLAKAALERLGEKR